MVLARALLTFTIAATACVTDELDELGEAPAALSLGWCGDAVAPFVSAAPIHVEEPSLRTVGLTTYLYFSDRQPDERRDLHVAVWIDGVGFVHLGPLQGVNTPAGLEGAPTVDVDGTLYFTDAAAPGMLSRGRLLTATWVVGKAPLPGAPPVVQRGDDVEGTMDLGVAPGLPFAALARGVWRGGSPLPIAADLWYLRRLADGSVAHVPAETAYFFGALTTPALEYAPELAPGGLELFYTQLDPSTLTSRIMTASRARLDLPFANPRVIATSAPGTLIEGPAITITGDRLFFHEVHLDGRPTVLRTMQRCWLP